jgi:hypothetical protein
MLHHLNPTRQRGMLSPSLARRAKVNDTAIFRDMLEFASEMMNQRIATDFRARTTDEQKSPLNKSAGLW